MKRLVVEKISPRLVGALLLVFTIALVPVSSPASADHRGTQSFQVLVESPDGTSIAIIVDHVTAYHRPGTGPEVTNVSTWDHNIWLNPVLGGPRKHVPITFIEPFPHQCHTLKTGGNVCIEDATNVTRSVHTIEDPGDLALATFVRGTGCIVYMDGEREALRIYNIPSMFVPTLMPGGSC